jgi:hypothetical protein
MHLTRSLGHAKVGWCDGAFKGAAAAGQGVGDSLHSWAFDGWRALRWHGAGRSWGARWSPGDVVGVACDCNAGTLTFTLNGLGAEVGLGVAFDGVRPPGGLYPALSVNHRERARVNFGGTAFAFPLAGYKAFADAACAADGCPEDRLEGAPALGVRTHTHTNPAFRLGGCACARACLCISHGHVLGRSQRPRASSRLWRTTFPSRRPSPRPRRRPTATWRRCAGE